MRIVGWFFPLGLEPASYFTPSDGHQLLDTFCQVSDVTDATWFSHQTSTGLRTKEKSCDIFTRWRFFSGKLARRI